jgi:hypothetical protein
MIGVNESVYVARRSSAAEPLHGFPNQILQGHIQKSGTSDFFNYGDGLPMNLSFAHRAPLKRVIATLLGLVSDLDTAIRLENELLLKGEKSLRIAAG